MRALRTGFVLTSVAGTRTSPVVVHIVVILQKHVAVTVIVARPVDTGGTAHVVDQQVVMESSGRTAPLRAIPACAFMVVGVVKALVHQTPLNGGEVVVVDGHVLFGTPSETAVVDDEGVGILDADAAALAEVFTIHADTSAYVADDKVARSAKVKFGSPIEDACSRGGLSRDGHVFQFGADVAFQFNGAAHPEHDGGILAALLQSPAEGALATVFQIGHFHHFPSAPAASVLAKPAGGGECEQSGLQRGVVFGCGRMMTGDDFLGIERLGASERAKAFVHFFPCIHQFMAVAVQLLAPTDTFCHIHGFSVIAGTIVFAEKLVLSGVATHLCPSHWMNGISKVAIQE